jgi:threonine dehydrogenase-like Zn-dependent dehydrogenase
MAGICGSDMGIFTCRESLTLAPFASYPFIVGHEVYGDIVELGNEVERFKAGDRVVVSGALGCAPRGISPACPLCQRGLPYLCENLTEGSLQPGLFIGACADTPGFMAEVGVAHESQLFKIPDGVSPEDAVMIDPFAHAPHMILRNDIKDNETVLVYGCGVMGLCTIVALRVLGFKGRILGVEVSPFHAEKAKEVGADEVIIPAKGKNHIYQMGSQLTGAKLYKPVLSKPLLIGGVNHAFDTVGTSETIDTSLRILANRGTFNLLGITEPKGMDWTPIWLKELAIYGVYGYGLEVYYDKKVHDFALTLEWLEQGKLNLAQFVTHKFTLDQWQQALRVNLNKSAYKAIKVAFIFPR